MRLLVLFIAAFGLLSACATIDKGMTDHLRVDTVPQGATVTAWRDSLTTSETKLDHRNARVTKATCITPCALPFARRSDILVRVEHPDFQTVEYVVTDSSVRHVANVLPTGSTALSGSVGVFTGYQLASFANAVESALTLGPSAGSANVGIAASGLGLSFGVYILDKPSVMRH